jgi:DNA-binding NarL/FixJ family response regulator
MYILLQGKDSQLTNTIDNMLSSVQDWQVIQTSSHRFSTEDRTLRKLKKTKFDVIVSNLADYSIPGKKLIKEITSHFPSSPLAVLHVFSRQLFIEPLLRAGASSYIQLGISEHCLQKGIDIPMQKTPINQR